MKYKTLWQWRLAIPTKNYFNHVVFCAADFLFDNYLPSCRKAYCVKYSYESYCLEDVFKVDVSVQPQVTFETQQKYKDLHGKKTYRFCNLRKWKDFNKKQLTLPKMCVTSRGGQRADL